jgi:hypothetical protein
VVVVSVTTAEVPVQAIVPNGCCLAPTAACAPGLARVITPAEATATIADAAHTGRRRNLPIALSLRRVDTDMAVYPTVCCGLLGHHTEAPT